MSTAVVVLEGARRAALYAALLFTFDAGPAAAQAGAHNASTATAPPMSATAASGNGALAPGPGTRGLAPAAARRLSPLAIDGSIADSGLTLAAHHVDVHVVGSTAVVRTRLTLRNDNAEAVSAHYVMPYPARVARGDAWDLTAAEVDALCDEDDLSPVAAEYAEAARAPQRLVRRNDVVVVAAGEQVALEVEREVAVASVGAVRRLSLPLPVDREAPWVPRFSADVFVEADRTIRRLSSPTHDALVDGIGKRAALLSIDGFVYRQAQLTVEFELDAPARGAPVLALDRAPSASVR